MKSLYRSLAAALLLSLAAAPGCIVDTSETGDEQDVTASAGHFETFKGDDGLYYFQLVASNGEELLRSDAYQSLSSAKKGITTTKKAAQLQASFELHQADTGEWYFNVKASNGQLLAMGETYATKSNANQGIATVIKTAATATTKAAATGTATFTTFKADDAKYYFYLRAKNGQIVLQSDAYSTKSAATKGITSVKTNGVDASNFVIDGGGAGQHAFRLLAANKQVIGRSQMYVSKSGAIHGASATREILRDLTGEGAADDATIQAEIEKASEGLYYTSESDYPFQYVHGALGPGGSITEDLVRSELASYVDSDADADKPLKNLYGMSATWQTWKDQAHNCADPNDPEALEGCQKMRNLEQVLESNLSDIRVYYFGKDGSAGDVEGTGVSIFIVGRSPDGSLVGVRTLAIWT